MQNSNFVKKISYCVSLLWLTLLVTSCQSGSPNDIPEPEEFSTPEDVYQAMKEAAELSPSLNIKSEPKPIIDRDSDDTVKTYLIQSKKIDEYWFKVTDYRLDWAGDITKTNLDKMTEEIDKMYQLYTNKGRLMSKLTGSYSATVPYIGGITVSGSLDSIMQYLGIVKILSKLKTKRVEIAIKGYADGERTKDWKRAVITVPDKYKSFKVLNPSDPKNMNWFFYNKPEVPRDLISDKYTNDDLPDMRAKFISEEFVKPFVERCKNKDICQTYVLHNKPISSQSQPQWRKVQIYIMIYLDRKNIN